MSTNDPRVSSVDLTMDILREYANRLEYELNAPYIDQYANEPVTLWYEKKVDYRLGGRGSKWYSHKISRPPFPKVNLIKETNNDNF